MITRFAMVGLVVVALSLLGIAPAGAAQAISVTPSTNLVDGQVVTVSGSGFQPNATTGMCEGLVATLPQVVCGTQIMVFSADAAGNFTQSFTVSRVLGFGENQLVDCADPSNACAIGASSDFTTVSVVPITFAPQPPLNPAISVTPNTNLVDGQVVTVSGSGFQPNASITTCEGVFQTQLSVTDCGTGNVSFSADSSGNFTGSFTATRFPRQGGRLVDCADPSNACAIAAADLDVLTTSTVATVAFSPQPPVSPRPDIMVMNRATGELYGDNVYDPTGGGVQTRAHVEVNGNWTFAVQIQNDGNVPDDLTVSAPAAPGVHYFVGYFDVTASVTNGGLTPRNIPPGGVYRFAVRESGLAPGASVESVVTVSSFWSSVPQDAVRLDFASSTS